VALKLGDEVGDLTFLRPDGSELHLAELRGRAVLLIFLRHLA
jgi:peroxiredoxin